VTASVHLDPSNDRVEALREAAYRQRDVARKNRDGGGDRWSSMSACGTSIRNGLIIKSVICATIKTAAARRAPMRRWESALWIRASDPGAVLPISMAAA
jgi:hypothetical protein